MSAQTINLYRPELDVQRRVPMLLWVLGSFCAGGVLVGAMAWSAYGELRELEGELDSLEAERQRLEVRHVSLENARADEGDAAAGERMARLEAERDRLQRARDHLEEVADGVAVQGFADPLRALARHQADGVWLTEIELGTRAHDWQLVGRAQTAGQVPAFIDLLDARVPFARLDDKAVEIRSRDDQAGVDFSIMTPVSQQRRPRGRQ